MQRNVGNWGELGGLILTNYEVKEFDTSINNFDSMANGQDFGFNHANAILELGFKDGDVYICNELYEYEKNTNQLIELAEGKFNKDIIMWCDSAEPDRIDMWVKAGYYRACGVTKTPHVVDKPLSGVTKKTYINSQIDWLKQRKIYIHPHCINTIKEIQQWKWQKDKSSGKYIDEPVNIFDDAMAALRYGCTTAMQEQASILDVL